MKTFDNFQEVKFERVELKIVLKIRPFAVRGFPSGEFPSFYWATPNFPPCPCTLTMICCCVCVCVYVRVPVV